MSSYPGGTDALTNPASGDHLNSPSHSAQHLNSNDAIEAIESATGTHSGTNILMNFVAGQFPVRNTGGGATGTLVQTLVGGTLQNSFIGTTQMTGGTITSSIINPVTSTTIKARVYLGTNQTNLPNNTWTKVGLDTENYDNGNNFASNKFTLPVTGNYLVIASLAFTQGSADTSCGVGIYRNGTEESHQEIYNPTTNDFTI